MVDLTFNMYFLIFGADWDPVMKMLTTNDS